MTQLISIIVAILSAFVSAALAVTPLDSVVIGLLAYLVSILTFVNTKLESLSELRTLKNELTRIALSLRLADERVIEGDDSFDVFWAISLRRAEAGKYQLIDSETFKVDKPHIPAFWQQMITNTDHTWNGTDHLLSDKMWIHGWSKHGLELQKACIAARGVGVKRIFIIDKIADAETPSIRDIMSEHRDYGILVKWISFESKLKWAPLQVFKNKIGTVDFTIINGRYLFAFYMHGRTLEAMKCFSNASLINEVKAQYDRLWDESNVPEWQKK
jgi:hypothetical protein